jgi:uncharacterized protein YecT (DUF1311 family)
MLHLKQVQRYLAFLYISCSIAPCFILPATAQLKIDCTNPNSNIEYKECARRAYLTADKNLNLVYKPIISSLNGKEKQRLVAAQSIWIKFRDANCDFEVYRNLGGTGYGGFLSNCLERMTKARTEELENWKN